MAPKRGGGGHRGRGRGRTSNTDDPSKNDKGKKKREGKEAEKLLQKSLLDMIPKRPMSEDDKKKVRKAAVKTKAGPSAKSKPAWNYYQPPIDTDDLAADEPLHHEKVEQTSFSSKPNVATDTDVKGPADSEPTAERAVGQLQHMVLCDAMCPVEKSMSDVSDESALSSIAQDLQDLMDETYPELQIETGQGSSCTGVDSAVPQPDHHQVSEESAHLRAAANSANNRVDSHGGRVDANQAPGAGDKFTLHHHATAHAGQAHPHGDSTEQLQAQSASQPQPTATAATTTCLQRDQPQHDPKVDEDKVADGMSKILEEHGVPQGQAARQASEPTQDVLSAALKLDKDKQPHHDDRGSEPRPHIADVQAEEANYHIADNMDVDETMAQEYVSARKTRLRMLQKLFRYPFYLLSCLLKATGLCSDAFDEPELARPCLHENGRRWIRQFERKTQQTSFSTSFSGIDTPSIALAMLQLGANELLVPECPNGPNRRTQAPSMNNLWACEKYGPSQEELLRSPHGPGCVFADMEGFWVDSVRQKAHALHASRMVESVLVPLVMSGRASRQAAWCVKHQKFCKAETADVHIAGTPCVAYSPRGSVLGLQDITVLVYLAWISQRRLCQECWVVQENVDEFPTDHLRQMLEDIYEIVCCVINPALLGWPVQRVRKYHVMRHRKKTTPFSCSFHLFAKLFVKDPSEEIRSLQPRWDVFLVAAVTELQSELEWASSRKESRQPCSKIGDKWMRMTPEGSYFQCLTPNERKGLGKYMDLFPSQVFQLNQNPDITATHSNNEHMFTLIRNAGVYWSDTHCRWLTPRECLHMQGIPTERELSFGTDVSSFSMDEGSSAQVNSRTAIIGQAGNAMHSEAVAIVWLFVLTQSSKAKNDLDFVSVSSSSSLSQQKPAPVGSDSGASTVARYFLARQRR